MAIERTFSIIKPNAVAKNVIGNIFARFEAAGFKIVGTKMLHLTVEQARGFYAEHDGKPFFDGLVEFMTCTRIAREMFDVDPGRENTFDVIRQFYVLVDSHFKEKKQVQDYADMLCRSPKTISNLFSLYRLSSPLRVIHERVDAEAKRLLLYTGKSAKEISEILGFEDLATFCRFFKKMNKESLSEYRKREKRE